MRALLAACLLALSPALTAAERVVSLAPSMSEIMLELGAERGRFLLGTLQRLAASLQLCLEPLLGLSDDRLRLLVQAPGEPADQIL